MTEEIKAIIEKNLPSQVGEILKTTLAKGQKDEAELKATVLAYDNARKEIEKHLAKIEQYKEFDKRNSELEAREKAIADRELKAEITELKYKLTESDKRAVDAVNFVGMALKSPIYRTMVCETEGGMQSWNGQLNRNEFVKNGMNSKTETKEID